jgi:hypothetical protein
MATLEKINIVLGDLEKTHGATIPIADLRQSMARVYEELASSASSSKAPASNSETCAAFTKPAKKSDAPKQCSKKGTNIGTDDKHYCAIHFAKEFPDLAAALPKKEKTPATSSSSASSAGKKPAAPKTTVGKGSLNPTCDHDIKGKNPRKCTSAGKCQQPDGKWYCGTHLKSHMAPAGGASSNDAGASNKIAKAHSVSQPLMDNELGLAVDQNGICFVGDYDGKGVHVVGRTSAGGVIDLNEADTKFCKENDYPIVPADVRLKIIAMTPEDRLKFSDEPVAESSA